MAGKGAFAGVLVSALLLGGCTSTPAATPRHTASADPAARDCRAEWKALGNQLAGRDQGRFVSDLGTRWAALQASVDYYATSATGDDCGARLDAQKKSVMLTEAFSTSLRVYDLRYRLAHRVASVKAYLQKPKKKPPVKLVRLALAQARRNAAAAATDMKDGWSEAATVDLTSDVARKKALSDLKFLAGDSLPYQRGAAALKVLGRVS